MSNLEYGNNPYLGGSGYTISTRSVVGLGHSYINTGNYFPLIANVHYSRTPSLPNDESWFRKFLGSIIMAIGSVGIMVVASLMLAPINAYLVIIMGTLGLIVVGLVTAAKMLDNQRIYRI